MDKSILAVQICFGLNRRGFIGAGVAHSAVMDTIEEILEDKIPKAELEVSEKRGIIETFFDD